MAILKHIKSRNANYSDAIDYLLFQHDESTGKKIKDEMGRSLLRDEFYMDGLNCDPMSFDKECSLTNAKFHKNKKSSEIKSHHYIISFDPDDKSECGLTGEKAQELCLNLAQKIFPGYQALIVTHTDGHNGSGNIHTHIVINSVRKEAVRRQRYMDKPHEEIAGYKHRSTNKFLNYFKKEIMDMCIQEGLHQVDLLSPAKTKITQAEYRAQKSGQKKLEETNKKIIADGLKPNATMFQTQKQELRNAIEECSSHSKSFQEFQSILFEKYQISVIEERGRYRYLHPDRDKRITEKALGTLYGKEHLEQLFLRKDPITITIRFRWCCKMFRLHCGYVVKLMICFYFWNAILPCIRRVFYGKSIFILKAFLIQFPPDLFDHFPFCFKNLILTSHFHLCLHEYIIFFHCFYGMYCDQE